MKVASILSVLTITITTAFSLTIAPEKFNVNIQQIIANPIAEFQRSNLKRKLIDAAKTKNEPLIVSLVEELSPLNPTPIPTQGLMGYNVAIKDTKKFALQAPLNGAWKLLFTNAKDAEAPARTEKSNDGTTTFKDEVAQGVKVKTGQRINAASGECVNYIQLSGEDESKKRPFDQLEITIQMTPLTDTRVRLDFVKGRALNEKTSAVFNGLYI